MVTVVIPLISPLTVSKELANSLIFSNSALIVSTTFSLPTLILLVLNKSYSFSSSLVK